MANGTFKAVFNVFSMQLAVRYGDAVSLHEFEEIDSWTKISFNGDPFHPYYLHVHLDYDESLQLLFYPREDMSPDLNEGDGTYFNSNSMDKIPEQIIIAFNDTEYENGLELISTPLANGDPVTVVNVEDDL